MQVKFSSQFNYSGFIQVLINHLFLQEDLGEHVVHGDTHPGHVGTACLLSSSFLENGKDIGVATIPIMGRNSRQTIGKVRGKILNQRQDDYDVKFFCFFLKL